MKYLFSKGTRRCAILMCFFVLFSILYESAPLLVSAETGTVTYTVDSLGGYDVSLSNHTLTYTQSDGDGRLTAIIGTGSEGGFSELDTSITYSNNNISWTGDTSGAYSLSVTNHTGSDVDFRLPNLQSTVTISNNTSKVVALDENNTHFEFALLSNGGGNGNAPGVGSESANIKLTYNLEWDTSERQDNELDSSVRIATNEGDNQIYFERFYKDNTTSTPVNVDTRRANYDLISDDEHTNQVRFMFGSSLLTKYDEITIITYSDEDFTSQTATTTLYSASTAPNNANESDIFFDYRVQDDVVENYFDHAIWFPIWVTPGASYSITMNLASTSPTRIPNFETISDSDVANELRNSEVQVGNFGWSYDASNSSSDDYIGGGRIEFVSLNYKGEDISELSNERGRALSWSSDSSGGEAVLPSGAYVTVRLIPDYGKQLTSFTLNGQGFQTTDAVSEYTFRISQGNFHLGASFTTVANSVTTSSQAVSSGNVSLSGNVISSGSGVLTVKESSDSALTTTAKNDGYNVDTTLDLSLRQLVYKGTNNASDAWRTPISELGSGSATVSLKLNSVPYGNTVEALHNHNGKIETVTSSYNTSTNTVTFTTNSFSNYVIASKTTSATAITLNSKSFVLAKGKSTTLKATLTPASAKDTITWKTSDSKIASVSSTGKVTAKKGGTATITATTSGGKKATCKVTVAAITLNATSAKLQVNKSTSEIQISDMTYSKDKISSVKSNKTSVLKVASVNKDKNTFKLTAKNKTGKAPITVTMKSGAVAKCTVNVQAKKVTTSKLTLSATKLTLKLKKSQTLVATRNPVTATEKITWTSSNPKVATVNSNGKVTAKKSGKATITAKTSNGKKATCKVTVKK